MLKQVPIVKDIQWLQRIQWIIDPVSYMEKAKKVNPDIFLVDIGGFGNRGIFVNSPEMIQYILTHDRKELTAAGDVNTILKPLLGDFGVIMLDGERHKRRRQLLMPPFHGERLRVYGELITKLTLAAIEEQTLERPFLARTLTQEISLQVIMQVVFGIYQGERYQKIKELLTYLADTFSSPVSSAFLFIPSLQKDWGPWSPWGNFLIRRKQLDDLIYTEINERRSQLNKSRTDILSLLMAAKDEAGEPMTNLELRDELMTMLFAGHETTATAMAWALYWIHREKGVKERLLKEIDSLGREYDPMEIVRLPYLSAVCNETLRIYPIGMLTFPRIVQEDISLFDYQLTKKDAVMGCIYLLHHREDLYPTPSQFKPERFLERQYTPYEFMPFGAGTRRCVGEALAQFEMKVVIATLLSNYEFALKDSRKEVPQRRGVTLAPKRGVPIKITGYRTVSKPSEVAVSL